MLSAAQMLDELMGRDRNLAPSDQRRETHWEDPDVCKYFLCGFCPHELFVNTRADLGQCDKLHDEKLKTSYEKSNRYERMGYEEEFLRFLQSLLSDVERRIRKGQARLCLNNTQGGMASGPQVAREEKISMLTEKINDLVQKAEELGCEGKVDDAQGMMKLCEQLTEERTQLENMQNEQPTSTFRGLEHTKDMQVCEICGALLVVGDAQQRVDEHLTGKQHMGYAQIRSFVERHKEKMRKKLRGEDEEREARLAKEREEREKERQEREKEREERRKQREQEDKERSDRRRHRSRSRSRRRTRSRSRERRHRRSRSKDRRRSRSRDRRRRSRSRSRNSRHRRSRSRGSRRSSRDRDRDSRRRSRSRDRRSRKRDDNRSSRPKEEDFVKEERMHERGAQGDSNPTDFYPAESNYKPEAEDN